MALKHKPSYANVLLWLLITLSVLVAMSFLIVVSNSDKTFVEELSHPDAPLMWIMFGTTITVLVVGFVWSYRLSRNINRLRRFVETADKGDDFDEETQFADDELGEISEHIISLYLQLRRASLDRDREHAMALHQEQEKIRIKRQLTNNINHELKTPVSSIQGYLETVLGNPDMDTATQREFLQKSYAQSERLRSLLQDISTITRMDEASSLIEREDVCLNQILQEIDADVALLPPDRHMRFNLKVADDMHVWGNHALLTSIFRNLTDNALAYSGGRDIYVTLTSEDAERYHFSFADNGIGVEERHLPHLFERFYRVDKGRSRKAGGTGLGLSIVKNAVIFHGGEIDVRNRYEGGLEFTFSLAKK